jgi:hypothetical protein
MHSYIQSESLVIVNSHVDNARRPVSIFYVIGERGNVSFCETGCSNNLSIFLKSGLPDVSMNM